MAHQLARGARASLGKHAAMAGAPSTAVIGARFKSTLRVAGVPEHFNAPFHIAAERGLYKQRGVDVAWHTEPKGTGAMAQLLEDDSVDLAVMLSEGATAKVAAGAPLRVVGTYVASSLRWGIHVRSGSGITTPEQLRGKTFGVSRLLSGSHLMAHVFAHEKGWNLEKEAPLNIVGSLDSAQKAMAAGEIDAWLWEKFTTKFLCDRGEWDCIGEVPTPWPCFLFVASQKALETKGDLVRQFVQTTRPVCDEFKANAEGSTLEYVAKKHDMSVEDASEWLRGTEWACSLSVTRGTLNKTQEALVTIGQLEKVSAPERFVDESVCALTGDAAATATTAPLSVGAPADPAQSIPTRSV